MDRNSLILITGAAGFIGSCMAGYLNRKGFQNLVIIDEFGRENKKLNYEDKKIYARVERDELFEWLQNFKIRIDFFFHFGARTDTTENDYSVLEELNLNYSKKAWNFCVERNIPFVYASSAATYGAGEHGYKDDEDVVEDLKPLNPYGVSKNEFDKWVLKQSKTPPFWAGLKFFNVYGPNEYHKGRMASVVFHAFNQVQSAGKVKLFKSHRTGYKDGGQLRDFIYVKDVVDICFWMMQDRPTSGIYNVGTGKARTFNDLAKALFAAMGKELAVEYIDTPADIRDKYQYFTEADMDKLRKAGYTNAFYSLEKGVETYVTQFLDGKKHY